MFQTLRLSAYTNEAQSSDSVKGSVANADTIDARLPRCVNPCVSDALTLQDSKREPPSNFLTVVNQHTRTLNDRRYRPQLHSLSAMQNYCNKWLQKAYWENVQYLESWDWARRLVTVVTRIWYHATSELIRFFFAGSASFRPIPSRRISVSAFFSHKEWTVLMQHYRQMSETTWNKDETQN